MPLDNMFRFLCQACGKRLKVPQGAEGKSFTCPRCQTRQVVPYISAEMVSHPLSGTKKVPPAGEERNVTSTVGELNPQPWVPISPDQRQPDVSAVALQLYNLLREKPAFVAWNLNSFTNDRHSWDQKKPPLGAFMAKFAAHLVICTILSFTGVGLIVSIPYALIVSLLWFGEREGYKAWRGEVDSLMMRLGADGTTLIEQAPSRSGFDQFIDAVKQYASISQQMSDAYRSTRS
jgi:hypothetical protein